MPNKLPFTEKIKKIRLHMVYFESILHFSKVSCYFYNLYYEIFEELTKVDIYIPRETSYNSLI